MDQKREYRIKEYLGEYTIQINGKNDWYRCSVTGGYVGLYTSPPMKAFKTLSEAKEMLEKLNDGPKYHYPEIYGLKEKSNVEINSLFLELMVSKQLFREKISDYNNLPWYKKIFVFEI